MKRNAITAKNLKMKISSTGSSKLWAFVTKPAVSVCLCIKKKYFQGDAYDRHLANVKERKDAARAVAREYVWNYLSSHPCAECGEADPMVLEFHHREEKDRDVSYLTAAGYSVATIQAEIDKCDVLCANCHRGTL